MSLTNIKDLDILICRKLDNKDLISFGQSNKYYNEIYNDQILWMLKILEFNIKKDYLCKDLNKEYYIELYNSFQNKNFVKVIFDAINAKRCDIVSLVFTKRNLDPNYIFRFRYEVKNCEKSYYSEKPDNNATYMYSPINLSVNTGYYPMWHFFHSNYKLELNPHIYIVSISKGNMKIFNDILKYNISVEQWVLIFSIRCYNLETTKIILDLISEQEINNMLNFMILDCRKEYINWVKEYNDSFAILLKKIDVKYFRRIGMNNKEFLRLLDFYILSIERY